MNWQFEKRCKALALAVSCFALACLGSVSALDYGEVKTLLHNRVAEEVVINMVKADGTIYITHEQAAELRSLGASENLVEAMRPRAITTTSTSTAPAAPTVIGTTSQPTIVSETATVISSEPADGTPISPVPIVSSGVYPPRYDKSGWVSIANHDWSPYYLSTNSENKRLFLSKFPNGGIVIESGHQVIVSLRKESYKMYGDSGEDLKVKVRENETTHVALNPFGVFGNSGLRGVSTDRDNVRSEVLFNNYMPTPTVIVQEPSVIVVPEPRPYYYHYGYPYGGGRRHYRGGSGGAVYFSW